MTTHRLVNLLKTFITSINMNEIFTIVCYNGADKIDGINTKIKFASGTELEALRKQYRIYFSQRHGIAENKLKVYFYYNQI